MPFKYAIRDQYGHKIGSTQRMPDSSHMLVGTLFFFVVLWKPLILLAVVVGIILLITVINSSLNPIVSQEVEVKSVVSSYNEQGAFMVSYELLNTSNSFQTFDFGVKLPVLCAGTPIFGLQTEPASIEIPPHQLVKGSLMAYDPRLKQCQAVGVGKLDYSFSR